MSFFNAGNASWARAWDGRPTAQAAGRLHGKSVEKISLEEAPSIAAELGLPVPEALPVHKGIALLMALDDKLAAALTSGAIKLIRADFMKQSTQPHLLRRQDLEALERDEQIAVFLKPDEAVALLRSNTRAIAALTYGWVTPDHPDETDEYLANMRRFLNHPLGAHIGGCFWDLDLSRRSRGPTRRMQASTWRSVVWATCTRRRWARRSCATGRSRSAPPGSTASWWCSSTATTL